MAKSDYGLMGDAEEVAKEAYMIYRSMKAEITDPPWDDLSGQDKGRMEWIVRYDRLRRIGHQ